MSKWLTTVNCKLFPQKSTILDVTQVLRSPLTTINQCFLRAPKDLYHRFWNGGSYYPAEILHRGFKTNNRNTKNTMALCEMCLELSVRKPQWRIDFVLVSLLLTFNRSRTFIWCFCRWLWASKCWFSRWIIERNLFWTRLLMLVILDTSISPP